MSSLKIVKPRKYYPSVKSIMPITPSLGMSHSYKHNSNATNVELAGKGILHRAITMIMDSIGVIKRNIYIDSTLLETEVIAAEKNAYWLWSLFRNLNPYMTDSKLFGLIAAQYLIEGEALVWFPKFDGKRPSQAYVLDRKNLTVKVLNKEEQTVAYAYRVGDKTVIINSDEICTIVNQFPTKNPETLYFKGFSTVEAVKEIYDMQELQMDKIKNYFEHKGVLPFVISMPVGSVAFEPAQRETLRLEIEGLTGYNNLVFLTQGAEIKEFPNTAKGDVDLAKSLMGNISPTSLTASVFGIPTSYLTAENPTYANYAESRAQFMSDTVEPIAWQINEMLEKHLRKYDSRVSIKHEPYLYDTPEIKRQQELHYLSTGQKTINDLRRENGLETTPEGDKLLIASNLMALDTVLNPQSPTFAGLSFTPQANKSYDENYKYWKATDDFLNQQAEEIKKGLVDFYDDLEKDMVSDKGYKRLFNFSLAELKKKLFARLAKPLTSLSEKSIERTLQDIGETTGETTFRQLVEAGVKSSTDKISPDGLKGLKEELQKVLNDNANNGNDKLFEAIRGKFKTLKTSRAATIARTTSTAGFHSAQQAVQTEVVPNQYKRVWISQRDGDVRPAHIAADGQSEKDGLFHVGGEAVPYPAGGDNAENNINCRCVCRLRKAN